MGANVDRVRRALAGAAALVVISAPALSAAQPVTGDFTVQRFDPAPGPNNYLTTRGARVDGKMAWSAGFFLSYARKPFVLESCASEEDCDTPNPLAQNDVYVVRSLTTFDALASLTPIPILQIGFKLPFTRVRGDGLARGDDPAVPAGSADPDKLSTIGVGDALLEGKLRLGSDPHATLVPGVALFVTGPLGTLTAEEKYVGDRTPTAGGRVIVDMLSGPLGIAANLGGVYRGESRVGSTEIGAEFRYGVGARYTVLPGLGILLDGFGANDFRSNNALRTLEIDGAVEVKKPILPLSIIAGGGAGVLADVGVPTYRLFVGALFAIEPQTDQDADGIPDDRDQCPKVKGDEEARRPGCPSNDRDDDMIEDKADKCPDQAEDPDGFDDTDGCPELDNDQDGIPDDADKCRDVPENKNGFDDDDGCPDEHDRDRDGVPDDRDVCRKDPEDKDGYRDDDGCPDKDNDKDGIDDKDDRCPDEPENKNDYEDDDGCPEAR